MWLRTGFVVALFFTGLVPTFAKDDGPPAYAPSPIDYADPLLMPANPPPQLAVTNPRAGILWEGEQLAQPSDHYQRATPSPDK
jgi:hypothetical protein